MSLTAADIRGELCEFSSAGVTCRGWFYTPEGDPPYACVVLAHGFGAAPDGPLGHVARGLAESGLAAFTFDFRHVGVSDGEPRHLVYIDRHLADWGAAIDYVRNRDDVDASRVGVWGSSLTGGEALCMAARDPAIAAAVAQAPYCDGHSVARAAGLRHNLRVLPAFLRDLVHERLGWPPYLIDGLGPPGSAALIDTRFPDLYEEAVRHAPQWQNRVAARALREIYRFRPIKLAHGIRCPLLVVVSYVDKVAPPGPAMRAADGLPYVELAMLQARHFEMYSGDASYRALRTECLFFAHHLLGQARPPLPAAAAEA